MSYFDPIKFLSGLTSYIFDIDTLRNVAYTRGISDYTEYSQLTEEMRALVTADLLFVIYSSPNSTATISLKHGNFSKGIGSQTYNNKGEILSVMRKIYTKYNDEYHLSFLPDEVTTQWIDDNDY